MSKRADFTVSVDAQNLDAAIEAALSVGYVDSQMEAPLTYKLDRLTEFLAAGDIAASSGMLSAFENQILAQRGKKISTKFADSPPD